MITKEQIKQYCENHPNLVSVKQTLNPELRVLKYKNKVFYNNLWTPELLECRGTVIDKDWNIVSRPFTKIFNYGENRAPNIHRDAVVIASQKINGFMAAATWYNGDILVSTTGSIDSKFADMAKESIKKCLLGSREYIRNLLESQTAIFEIVRDDDPHIVDEEPGVYLLNIRRNYWGSPTHAYDEQALDFFAVKYGSFKRPKWKISTWKDIKNEVKTCQHEGYVVWDLFGKELKIKSPFYLTTKFIGRMGDKKVELMYNDPEKFKKNLDEEFYEVVSFLTSSFSMKEYLELSKQQRITIIRDFFIEEL